MSSDSPSGSGSTRKTPSTRLLLRATLPGSPPEEVYVGRRLSIGRSVDNVFCIEDQAVDRHHAEVQVDPLGRFVVRCVAAGGYLEVGENRVSELVLEPGVRFRIGPGEFECLAGDPIRSEAGKGLRPSCCPRCGTRSLPAPSAEVQHCGQCGEAIVVLGLGGGAEPLVVPARVSQLEVLRVVGQGGMGVVLEGRRLDSSQRVAIKLMLPHLVQQEEYLRRFRREIALLRAVRHPHVVRIVGWGKWVGVPCLVMAWIEGQSLRHWMGQVPQRGLCPWAQASRWLGQVVAGLWAIHRAGLVHRDIKPSNILIDAQGNAYVADLGVARRVQEASTALTSTGVSVGTFVYMAPEQIYSPERVDARADQYGLGATFYELLTGQPPLGRWVPASQRNRAVPAEFDRVLQRLLERQASDRYADMDTLAQELRGLGVDVPIPPPAVASSGGQAGASAARYDASAPPPPLQRAGD